ncbi:methylated-DNA--protein-cysteine methyltransferase isoform X3 [Phascolarctos cinereus]|uniref:Methylated-DNA--protein-cysteine methyltransferase n=1 Tax=Phascolarctos cinereus TaxID=38626 RepID=A0A6P5JKZ9_PHACI|nr:methylated-DNA--protein-cysteine methyltransferase isoform X2 [Phascolarctos cinereus]
MMGSACRMKYKFLESPLGRIEISGCEAGVHRIKLLEKMVQRPDGGSHQASFSGEELEGPEETPAALDKCAAWLAAYFHAPETVKDLPLPAFHHPIFQRDSFRRQVLWKLMAAVKLGDTVSYQQLAALVGKSGAARAVGGAMRDNPCPDARPRDMQKEACAQKLNEAWLMKYQPHMKAATRHCHGDRSNGAGYRRAKGLSLSSKGAAAHSLEDTHVHPYC